MRPFKASDTYAPMGDQPRAIAEIAAATNRLLETLGVEVEEGPDRWVPSGATRSGLPTARPMRDRREGVGV